MVPPLYTGASGSFLSSWALRDGSPGERAALQNETVRTHPDAGMPRTNMVSSVHVHHPQALLSIPRSRPSIGHTASLPRSSV